MANSYSKLYIHYIFSTKHRKPTIEPKFMNRLWRYIAGTARDTNMEPLAVGGISNHIHALIILPPTLSVSDGIQILKGSSSKWINDHSFTKVTFRWQSGYGAFSVGYSQLDQTISYIRNQKSHHQHKTFKEEYLEILEYHQIDYNPDYVLG